GWGAAVERGGRRRGGAGGGGETPGAPGGRSAPGKARGGPHTAGPARARRAARAVAVLLGRHGRLWNVGTRVGAGGSCGRDGDMVRSSHLFSLGRVVPKAAVSSWQS